MKWYDYIAMGVLTPLVIWLFIGWLRSSYKHDQEKEDHRRFGGAVPKNDIKFPPADINVRRGKSNRLNP